MLRRAIPVLTIDDSDLVKKKQFKDYKYVGDPINAVKIFNEKYVDELIVLDITKDKVEPDYNLIKSFTNEAFMPLTYGGGVSTIEQMKKIYRLGVEKISLNSTAFKDPELIKEAVSFFGSQSVVASIDYKNDVLGRTYCYINNGKNKTKYSPVNLAKHYEKIGVGELLITSIEREGTKKGYDYKLLEEVIKSVNIPVIVNGGASSREELIKAIDISGAAAAAAGALFVLQGIHDAVLISYENIN